MYQKFIQHDNLRMSEQVGRLLKELVKKYNSVIIYNSSQKDCGFVPGLHAMPNFESSCATITSYWGEDDYETKVASAKMAIFMPELHKPSQTYVPSKLVTLALHSELEGFGKDIESSINKILEATE